MFTLAYDLGMWCDETVYETFDTVEDLLERYEDIKYEVCEIRAFDEHNERFAPWAQKKED